GHLMNLARELDNRINGLRTKFGEIGDTRLTVMAAITVADELAEAGQRIKRLEEKLAALQKAQGALSDRNKAAQAGRAASRQQAAQRGGNNTKGRKQTNNKKGPAGGQV